MSKKEEIVWEKVLQIMPATVPMWAVFALDEKEAGVEILFVPVLGWQLLEDLRQGPFKGFRYVAAIVTSRDGLVENPRESENFLGFSEDKDSSKWQEEAREHIKRTKKPHPVEA